MIKKEIVFIRLDLIRDALTTFLQDNVNQFAQFTTVVTSLNIQFMQLNIHSISLSAFLRHHMLFQLYQSCSNSKIV